VNVEHFSDWRRLYRAVATFILYIEKLKATARKTTPITSINAEMIRRAQTTLIRYAQVSEFRKEICLLSKGKALNANSKLICLYVFLDDDQLLRIRGRAENMCPQQQIVLPYGHYVTRLIVNWYHRHHARGLH